MVATSFFLVALLYSMVGFGGGSSYIAILALIDTPYRLIPVIALICNITVVLGNNVHFLRKGFCDLKLASWFAMGSVPMSYLGGRIPVSREAFFLILGICLGLAGLRLLFFNRFDDDPESLRPLSPYLGVSIGAVIGFISGLVGIGGGIFLSPILLLFRWAHPMTAAAIASLFILANSVAGLAGQVTKGVDHEVLAYWPLFICVAIGGQMGSLWSSSRIPQTFVKNITALLVLGVSARLLLR